MVSDIGELETQAQALLDQGLNVAHVAREILGALKKKSLREDARKSMVEIRNSAEMIDHAANVISKLLGEDPGNRQIVEFFEDVGMAMERAQRSLDKQSRDYTEYAAKGLGDVTPTMFRIPKVEADFHFALDTTQQRRLNVLFFSSGKEKVTSMKQSVKFEIVAAPPSQEFIRHLGEQIPDLRMIMDAATRGQVRRVVLSKEFKQNSKEFRYKKTLLENWNQALLLRASLPPVRKGEKTERYERQRHLFFLVVVRPGFRDKAKLRLDIWGVNLEEREVTLADSNDAKLSTFRRTIAQLGSRQANVLGVSVSDS